MKARNCLRNESYSHAERDRSLPDDLPGRWFLTWQWSALPAAILCSPNPGTSSVARLLIKLAKTHFEAITPIDLSPHFALSAFVFSMGRHTAPTPTQDPSLDRGVDVFAGDLAVHSSSNGHRKDGAVWIGSYISLLERNGLYSGHRPNATYLQ